MERRALSYIYLRTLEAWLVQRLRRVSASKAVSRPTHPRRLYLDVSVISKHDAATGIQRMVRAVAMQLLATPPTGWEVHAITAARNRPYHVTGWPRVADVDPDVAGDVRPDVLIGRPGDVFLGLDLALDTVRLHHRQLQNFRRAGGLLWFTVYDLLPLQRPEWFSDKLVVRYRKWMRVLAGIADGFCCISQTVQSELRRELDLKFGLTEGFRSIVLPMGWDLENASSSTGMPPDFEVVAQAISVRPTALMVGTIEPRKGHADVLCAFERIWSEGHQANLVIVGRPGWKTEALQRRLLQHAQQGTQLFWLPNASDEALSALYASCDGVIAASMGEGYGLPVLEALGHGKPVLARDLPVFRGHPSRDVTYFPRDIEAVDLARAIVRWLGKGTQVSTPLKHELTIWADTARAIAESLLPACPEGLSA